MPLHHDAPHRPQFAWRDLDIALRTAASLQTSIRHADAKAATLLGVQGGASTLAVGQAPALFDTGNTAVLVIAAIIAMAFVSGLVGTTWHLLCAMAPRLARPSGPNRFAFPAATQPVGPLDTGDVGQQCDEAWGLVSVLGATAVAKHLHVRRSLPWLALTTGCEGVLLAWPLLVGAVA